MNKILDLLHHIKNDESIDLNLHINSRVLIIDGINTFLRAFAAVNHLNQYNNHIGGITGFLTSIGYAVSNIKPTRIIIIFDGEDGSVNKRYLYPDYKKNRENAGMVNSKMHLNKSDENEAKITQISRLMDYLSFLPVTLICIDKYEADDIIGFTANYIHDNYKDSIITIMSSDRDFFQLINKRICVYSPTKKRTYFEKDVLEEFGVHPNNFLIYKTILGDTSDNVKGVHGIGEKKSISLFPELSNKKEMKLDDLVRLSENRIDENKLYGKVVSSKNHLKNVYQIMNLRNPNISEEVKEEVLASIYDDPFSLQRYDFLKLHRSDRLERSFNNPERYLENFSYLQVYKNEK